MKTVDWYASTAPREWEADMGIWFRMHVKEHADGTYSRGVSLAGPGQKRHWVYQLMPCSAQSLGQAQRQAMVAALRLLASLQRQLLESLD